MQKIKCAIYTRKSTEHGLELEFNSLQNQEESCKAYITSQAFNGWEYVKTYSDAAISGGTMDRPALQQMLTDMAHGLINTVVVYKVDRLSRSILDFHNMMKYFDKYNCNFVSITQAFDTSTSMGKLTLNMLLSFAQFEREVSSERVRDKIRASKAKGLWMGGIPPLGYDIKDKKLVINEAEAQQVKTLFEQYLEFQSVSALTEFAELNGIWAKKWQTRSGDWRGGKPITQMSMHRILRDKTYIGFISHKANGTCARGAHEPIISDELFNAVQTALQNNTNNKSKALRSPNLLTGKLFNNIGIKFTNQRNSGKNQKTKYYYASKGFYLPAPQLDAVDLGTFSQFLDSDLSALPLESKDAIKRIDWTRMTYDTKRNLIQSVTKKVIYSNEKLIIHISLDPMRWQEFTGEVYINETTEPIEFITSKDEVIITVPVILRKYATTRIDKDAKTGVLSITDNNHLIVKAFATAWRYKNLYEGGAGIKKIARDEKRDLRTIYKYLNLAYLSPKIINSALNGELHNHTNIQELFLIAEKHENFDEQEKAFYEIN